MKCAKCEFENPADTIFCGKCGTQLLRKEEIPTSLTKTLPGIMRELTAGSTFARRYEIIEQLGKGGMGKVYKVLDKEVKEEVALKLLNPEIATDERTIERFRNELRLARKISHRNVCRMYDLGKEEGTQYITMEYVPGEDLKTLIRRSGELTLGNAVFVARQVCEGLAEAHELGVVHRDLKPQNIMIDSKGNAHIMDFGIARSMKAKGLTETGMIIGTPDYMSPEQVEGKKIDQRSDIYSLGVILYEMVTGKVPFEGETPLSIAVKHITEIPRNPKELNVRLPEKISRVILRCMEKDRDKRYLGIDELLTDLINIDKDLPTADKYIPEIKLEAGTPRKHMVPKILLLVAIVIVAGYFFYDQVLQKGKKEKEATPAVVAGQTTQETAALTPQPGYIEIDSTPEGAEVYLDNIHEGTTPFKSEYPSGTYEVRITKSPEYRERTDVLIVNAGETSSKNYTLIPQEITPQASYIEISSIPEGAEVYLDDKHEGTTPFKRRYSSGTYKARITKTPEYKEITDVLNVKEGETLTKNYPLAPVYILEINTTPEEADIRIDGNYKGKTPIQIELPRSTCQLRIEKGEGWFSIDESLTLKAGINTIQRALTRIKYSLSIRTNPPEARVFIGDKLIGNSPARKSDLLGVCDIKIEKDGYKTIEESIDIKSDIERIYDLTKLELVKIRINVHPYANVLIDGKSIGEIPPIRIHEIEGGKHTIEFVSTDLNKRYSIEVEIKAGESKEIRMNMETGVSKVVNVSLIQ